MTDQQFNALSTLLRLRDGPARDAARLVLVAGQTVPEAAASRGVSYMSAYQSVRRVERGLELAREAVGK